MTARPPRATTKGEGRRPKPRGQTQGERARRPASLLPTDQFERIADDDVVEVAELPEVPQLRLLVLEAAPHLASAQGAIVAAGHVVVIGASGAGGVEKLRFAVGDVDALLVGLPGGEALIDVARAHPRRPLVIAASTCSAVEAARRAAAAGADLATVRPHDVERLAPILMAAARLVEQRRQLPAAPPAEELGDVLDGLIDPGDPGDPGDLGDDAGDDGGQGFVAFDQLHAAALRALDRAKRYGYPLSIAMFRVEIPEPAPPPALRGILRARAGNALVHALRDIDVATALDEDRFLVVLPHTERAAAAEVARRVLGAVTAGDPVVSGGRAFPPKVYGAVVVAAPDERESPQVFDALVLDAHQLLEQAQVTGASLAVET
jgi:hypothetical protein